MDAEKIPFVCRAAVERLFALRKAKSPISWRTFGIGVTLASFMNKSGGCYPSRRAIAQRAGVTIRAVSYALRRLEKLEMITTVTRIGRANLYQLMACHDSSLGESTEAALPETGKPPLLDLAPRKNHRKNHRKKTYDAGIDVAVIPADIKGLQLYESDKKLCTRWAELCAAWREAFPAIDILAEVKKAHAWEVANPSRRKHDRGRFLQSWLSRAQDDFRTRTRHDSSKVRAPSGKYDDMTLIG